MSVRGWAVWGGGREEMSMVGKGLNAQQEQEMHDWELEEGAWDKGGLIVQQVQRAADSGK